MFLASMFGHKETKQVDNYMAGAVYAGRRPLFDRSVLVASVLLLLLSVVMIYTASIGVLAAKVDGDTFFFVRKQLMFILLGGILSTLVLTVPMQIWARLSKRYLIWFAILLLAATYFMGSEINGAKRWLNLGFFNLQSTELLKLVWILYLGGYFYRHIKKMESWAGVVRPLFFLGVILGFIYLQDDFGSVVVVSFVTIVLFFISGLSIKFCFTVAVLFGGPFFAYIIMTSPYRVARILNYLEPWKDEFGKSYQLLNSFMAIGRGDLTGQGLGESLFKLAYLPEPHTDFILSIWVEETGFVGAMLVLGLEFFLIFKMSWLGLRHLKTGKILTGEIALGISMWFLAQVFINVGSITGLIPPKGLTLPLLSYGGSSLVMMMAAIAVYLRISYEERMGLYTEYLAELKSVRRMERRQALNKMNEALALAQKEADAQKNASATAEAKPYASTVVFKGTNPNKGTSSVKLKPDATQAKGKIKELDSNSKVESKLAPKPAPKEDHNYGRSYLG